MILNLMKMNTLRKVSRLRCTEKLKQIKNWQGTSSDHSAAKASLHLPGNKNLKAIFLRATKNYCATCTYSKDNADKAQHLINNFPLLSLKYIVCLR